MTTALVIGGTGFVGRHTVTELLEDGYSVTVLSRGTVERPFDDRNHLTYVEGDRTDDSELSAVAAEVDPDIVIDCAAFQPQSVRDALHVFADVEAYVYVSSGGVYDSEEIPKREDTTPLHEFTPAQSGDLTMATYGPRKAECDRLVTRSAGQGLPATSVRPTMIYGPKTVDGQGASWDDTTSWAPDVPGLQNHHEYWIDRVRNYDEVVIPGDGTAIWHRVYVEDVARALRLVAENGEPGEAYNVADRRVLTLEDVIDLIAETLGTSVDVHHASARELEQVGLEPDDFVLYHHLGSDYPHVLSTCKISSLGFESTPVDVAMEHTVEESLASDRDGRFFDPGREAEASLLDRLDI